MAMDGRATCKKTVAGMAGGGGGGQKSEKKKNSFVLLTFNARLAMADIYLRQ